MPAALRLSHDARWIGFFGLILVSWLGLWWFGDTLHGAPLAGHGSHAAQVGLLPLWAMWALMALAMMAPTFVPTLRTYDDLTHTRAATRNGVYGLLAGYVAVWLGYALLGAVLQHALAGAGLMDGDRSASAWLNVLLLAAAGGYQLSRLKDACLSQCRAPMAFFMGHWRPGTLGAARMGVHLGLICAGCCWALMLLGFVGGTMNLVWMGVATLLMTLEKLPQLGERITRPLGWFLLLAAVLLAARTLA